MNRIIRIIAAVFFIAVITFSSISILDRLTRSWRRDITSQKIYTISDGTKKILSSLNQPIKMKLYYTKTAALKAPDQIRYYNNYYYFVKELLEEYVRTSKGMIQLEIIDPGPFSDEELEAIRYGLKRLSVTQEESFFFGLVVQTPFGVQKAIEFFQPARQTFIEYDISCLIDTAITRQKKRIGVLSALPITGDNVTGYLAYMMQLQGQVPKQPWMIINQLRQKYEVVSLSHDADKIENIDLLLVIHPKDFAEKTLFTIDQFILTGARTIICIDPHCVADIPDRQQIQPGEVYQSASSITPLLNAWGLDMPENTFAADRTLAVTGATAPDRRPEKILTILSLTTDCFNHDCAITGNLNNAAVMFPGALKKRPLDTTTAAETPDTTTHDTVKPAEPANQAQPPQPSQPPLTLTPLIMTTNRGNTWSPATPYEISSPDYAALLQRFTDGTEPVVMGYMITGRFKSAFPSGIQVPDTSPDPNNPQPPQPPQNTGSDKNKKPAKTKTLTGLTHASADCAVAVFADVDFISDLIAFRETFFGTVIVGDNSALLQNTIEDLSGSGNLISIRSRGGFRRPFKVVDDIEAKAQAQTDKEEARINTQIEGFKKELAEIVNSAKKGQGAIVETTIIAKQRDLELKIAQAQQRLRLFKMTRRQSIETLGNRLRNFCTLPGPAVILLVAVILGIRRTVMRRYYISHASDS